MGCPVPSWSHPGVPRDRDGTKFFFMGWDGTKSLWDGSSRSHAKPGPGRDGTRPWWDGSSHSGPAVSLGHISNQSLDALSVTVCNQTSQLSKISAQKSQCSHCC